MPKPYLAETLLIEGPDAMAFAHAQFSSNVVALDSGQWRFSAWLDPQGRVRAFFHLARIDDERLLLLLRGGEAVSIAAALRRFVFRSKVTLAALSPRFLSTGDALPVHAVHDDGDDLSLGCGAHSLRISREGGGDDAWRLPQLRHGWPWLPASQLDALLASALSLQRLQAVAIDKGCYPGQEIVARLHFRGGNKKHLHRITLSPSKNPGDSLRINGQEKGCVIDVIHSDLGIEALAVLNDDIVSRAVEGQLESMDEAVSIRVLEAWNV